VSPDIRSPRGKSGTASEEGDALEVSIFRRKGGLRIQIRVGGSIITTDLDWP